MWGFFLEFTLSLPSVLFSAIAHRHLYTMAIKAINSWLNGAKDYTEGTRLYQQYGSSKVLANLFAQSQNSYTVNKLLQELQQLNEATEPQPVLISSTGVKTMRQKDIMRLASFKPKKQQHTFVPVDLTNAPKALQQLDQRRRQLFQQAAEVKAALDAEQFTTHAERFKAVKLIDENFYGHRGIQQIWQRIDFWQKYGRFLPFHATKPSKPVDREALHKRLTTVRTYLSRYKKKGNADKYDEYLKELLDIEQKLIDNGEA
jgi:hypothetical protein